MYASLDGVDLEVAAPVIWKETVGVQPFSIYLEIDVDSANALFDSADAADEPPHVVGRARFGRIAVANSDAGGRATLDTAIDQAYRAIEDLAEL